MALKLPSLADLPPRRSDNDKRRLVHDPSPVELAALADAVIYQGSSKHKLRPSLYGLPPYRGDRGDATLCDRDAGFEPSDMPQIPSMIRRGIEAGLVDQGWRIFWAVADDGSMFEFRLTNATQSEYHGYPLRRTEAIAENGLPALRSVGWGKWHADRPWCSQVLQDEVQVPPCLSFESSLPRKALALTPSCTASRSA